MVIIKIKEGEFKTFASLKETAEYLLQRGYEYVKSIKELSLIPIEEYNILPAIRITKAGYIQVITK